MAVFSKPVSVNYSCYELGHTWTPSCTKSTLSVALDVFREAVKIYGSLYLVAAILRKRGKKYFKTKFLEETGRSTLFLTTNGTLFIMLFCVWRKITGFYFMLNTFACGIPACALSVSIERKHRNLIGHFNYISTAFLPAATASYLALLIERTNRRGLLAVYMLNVATETFYRMAAFRGWVKPIKHGEVLLFSVAMAVYLYLFRKNSLPKSVSSLFSFLLGKDELPAAVLAEEGPVPINSSWKSAVKDKVPVALKQLNTWLKRLSKHSLCGHNNSCVHYVLQGFSSMFCGGFVVQGGIKLISALPRVFKNPKSLWLAVKHKENFKLAAFLGCFSAIFRAVNCLLRWARDNDDELHGLLAGFLAGFSMMWYKSVTIAMYAAVKLGEILYFKGIDKKMLPYIKYADIILYSLSTAFVFHVAVVEPHNLRPAYWKFLLRVTGNKFAMMNRKLMEPMVPFASKINPDFWPKYDPRYTNLVEPMSHLKS